MGASNAHRSPNFCSGTFLSVINQVVPFFPLYIVLHMLSYFATSSSRHFQQACPQLRVNELDAWQSKRSALPHTALASRHSHRQWEMLSICPHAVHLGSTLGPLPHVPTGKALCAISHKHIIILRSYLSCHTIFQNLSSLISLMPSCIQNFLAATLSCFCSRRICLPIFVLYLKN